MKNTKKSKILSLLLCGAMILSTFAFMPAQVDAADEKQATEATQQTETKESAKDAAAQTEDKAQDTKVDQASSEKSKQDVKSAEKKTASKAANYTKVAPFVSPIQGKATKKSVKAASKKSAVQTQSNDSNPDNSLQTNKTVSKLDDKGNAVLTLEAYATGSSVISTTEKSVPTDVVLILDQSGSMKKRFTNNQTRLAALKAAANQFAESVADKAKEDDVDHRIAVVGFASTKGQLSSSYNNTEILSTSSVVNYGSARDSDYNSALVSANNSGTLNSRISTAINRLDASGDTYSEYGIDMANKIFEQNPVPSNEKRNRVIVMFTDGYTAPSGTNDFKYSMANNAIDNAYTSKTTYNATVYTVGIFGDADPQLDINTNFKSDDGWYDDYWNGSGNQLSSTQATVAANRYMHYVSSNYPNARSLTNGGEIASNADPFHGGNSYYLSASDSTALNDIFQKISDQIQTGGTSVTLDEKSVVKDVISDYFDLPEGTDKSKIEVYTANCTGKDKATGEYKFATKQEYTDANVSLDGKTISVTNFDFADNWVGTVTQNGETTYRGKKLIIEIPIKVRDGFWGGNKVITNGAGSGVFENSEATESVEDFTSPTLDVPINVPDFTANDKTIYYGSNVAADSLFNKVTLPESEAWKAAYVDATYSSPGSISNTDCGTYDATLTLTPKHEGTQTEKSKTATSKVHVLVPQVEYNDSEIYLGEKADYNDNIPNNNVSWVDMKGHTGIPEATGTAPELSFEYSPAEDYFEQDTPVNAVVKVGNEDITNIVIFKNGEHKHKGDADKEEFTVKVKTCELTITKEGHENVDENQSFVFHVKGDDSNKYSKNVDVDVIIHGDGSTVVKNLPLGNYTVTEDQGWSWRYTPTAESRNGSVTLTKSSPSGAWTFVNERQEKNWLNGSSWCKNIFKDGEIKQSRTTTKN